METIPPLTKFQKRNMHFHRQTPRDLITASFPNPKTEHIKPSNVSISAYHTPESVDKAVNFAETSSPSPPHSNKPVRQPLLRSQSSTWWMEIRKSPTPQREPQSRKTAAGTIVTDTTREHPAFESDAFAVQMPTTREPILDTPGAPVFRTKLPSPPNKHVEAYQMYKEKAKRDMEREYSKDLKPVNNGSCDFAYDVATTRPQSSELHVPPPASPSPLSTGAFPISPPIAQQQWTTPLSRQFRDHRSVSESSNISVPRKPVGLSNVPSCHAYTQDTAEVGALHPPLMAPTPSYPKIKIRLKPKGPPPSFPAPSPPPDKMQTESWFNMYSRSSPRSSNETSRATSPSKSSVNFAYTTAPYTHSPAAVMSGYQSQDITNPDASANANVAAGAATSKTNTPSPPAKLSKKEGKPPPKKTLGSRLAWLRPAGPRVNKPAATTHPPTASTMTATTYVDPFILHSTPPPTHTNTPFCSRPVSPQRKLVRTRPVSAHSTTTFDTGFAQVKGATLLILKICLCVYLLVLAYFVLDVVRQAVYAVGAPLRAVKCVLMWGWWGVVWAGWWVETLWEWFGIQIAFKE